MSSDFTSEGHMNQKLSNTIFDLRQRWEKSRLSAIRTLTTFQTEFEFFKQISTLSETEFDSLIKKIFLNSKTLGMGYQKKYSIVWERSDISIYFQNLGSPCLMGGWDLRKTANVLTRFGCQDGKLYGGRVCLYWREAIDGLVLGLSEDVGFVRHASFNSGGDNCVDIFYQEEKNLTDAIWSSPYRWGKISKDMLETLLVIENKFLEYKIKLKFLGQTEQNLFYKMESKENLICGATGSIYRNILESSVKDKFPAVQLQDASPVAVYGERA